MRSILTVTSAIGLLSCASVGNGPQAYRCPEGAVLRMDDATHWCVTLDGRSVGTILSWHDAGQISAVSNLRDGQPIATVTFYETGEVRTEQFHRASDGRVVSRHWYRDGSTKIHAEWHGEQLHGEYRSWYENGLPQSEGLFVHGKRSGTWKFWDGDGDSARIVNYDGKGKPSEAPASLDSP